MKHSQKETFQSSRKTTSRKPSQRNPQSYAWWYFMTHYVPSRRHNSTGFGYLWQAFAAFLLLGAVSCCAICMLLGLCSAETATVALILIAAAFWLIRSLRLALHRMHKAAQFAEGIGPDVKNIAEVEHIFNETYPWIFYE